MKDKVLFLLLLINALFSSCKENNQYKHKNILFILVDDLGYYDLSCTGSQYYETPNIDQIAKEGMTFTNGYAACQVCSPSRASIMTGQFPARHGITDWIGAKSGEDWRKANRYNKLLPAEYKHHLDHNSVTIAEALKSEGYKTFFAGKWHLGDKGSWPDDHGFDINVGGWSKGGPAGGYFSPFKNPNLEDKAEGENLSMRLARETVSFLRNNKDTSFFAFLSFYAVHSPIQTTQEKWSKYQQKANEMGIAEKGFDMGHFLPIRQVQDNPVYAGLVETMDDAVGLVLKELEALGLDKNTIVVFTSDNGGVAAGDAFSTSNKPLRAGKGYQYEGGIREPYFIKVPWIDCAGKQNSTPVSGTDFYPTLLELIGADLNPGQHNDGVSLVPLLKGDSIESRPLIWHYPHYGNQGGEPSSIIRMANWKLIHYYEDGRDELYNLEHDLVEKEDLSLQNPEIVEEMSNTLFNYLNSVGAKFPVPDPEYNPEKESEHLKYIRNVKWPNLEKNRMRLLSEDFDPKNNWWGSQLTTD